MLKYFFPIAIAFFAFSCTTEEKPTSEVEVEETPEISEDDKPQKEYDPSSVLSRSEEFFDWYLRNSRTLYKMRSSCIGAENGYHALNKTKLEAYTKWLTDSKFFSDRFIEFEHNRWTSECAEDMRKMARQKKHYTGPPPCLFEGDVFFKMHAQPTQEMIDALEHVVSEQTDDSAVVSFKENRSLNWSYIDGTWKIDAWP